MKMERHSSNPKILITGIEGFTGHHLSAFCRAQGMDVYGTSLSSSSRNIFRLDVNDYRSLMNVLGEVRPDFIVHLAAISFANQSDYSSYYSVNTVGTELLLEAVLNSGMKPKKVLIPSSATVYGNQNSEVLSEDMTPQPTNHYGCSKLAMELLVRNYFERIPIIITRPFNYTGSLQNENFIVPKLTKHFKEKKKVVELGNINTKREINSVTYLSEVYYRLLNCSKNSITVNVCSGKTYSIATIIKKLENITAHKIKVEINPDFIRKNEIQCLRGDIQKLSGVIDMPELPDLDYTLKQMLND